MNNTDNDAALAQKEQDERRRLEDELLANDPGYLAFLKTINNETEKQRGYD